LKRISKTVVIGLGKLGAPLAAALAHRGFEVTGIDLSERAVSAINRGEAPVDEPGLATMIAESRERLRASTDFDAVRAADAIFILVPTPSEPAGGFSMEYVLAAARRVGAMLRDRTDFPLVVLTSTVMPGDTEGRLRPVLEEASGMKCGEDFGLAYNPEFIALGSVIRDLLNPDFVLVGESDARTGELLEEFYGRFGMNAAPVARMAIVNAEITKLSVNTFVTTKIAFANMLARICEAYPGADVDVVTRALGRDSRIGAKYLKGSVAYGGPCFPRDNKAMAEVGRRVGVEARIARTTDLDNRAITEWLAEKTVSLLPEGGTVGLLGLAYKPDTNVAEESQGVWLARALAAKGVRVKAHDPAAGESGRALIGATAAVVETVDECLAGADVVLVLTPWPEYAALAAERFADRPQPVAVIDCWRVLGHLRDAPGIHYVALGVAAKE
jgi:UDPglucose 6-dehydrogenase